MNSRDYWAKREAEQLKHNITEEAEYNRRIEQIYRDMLDACQKEIDSFYGKYARKEGITLAEAKKRVSQLDIAAYERKAKKYVKEKNFTDKANEEMRLYNATMKINRLEMLKANIGLELIAGHDELEKFMQGILQGRTEDELARQAGILGKTIRNNAQKAHAIVNGSFHSGTFSDRIWQYQDLMREDLGRLLQTGLIQGKNPRAIAAGLRQYWYGKDPKTGGGATYCMERLMRTELARVQTEAQKQSFVRNGFTQYTFIVNGGCCPICEGIKNKHFDVEKMMPGENAPPMHPNCRCSTAAYEDSEDYNAWLDHLANGGTTEEWNKQKEQPKKTAAMRRDPAKFRQQQREMTIDDCKTVEDVEKLLKSKKWFSAQTINGKVYDSSDGITLAGADLECAKSIFRTHERLFTKYPQLVGKLNAVDAQNLGHFTYAQCHFGFGHGGISVNTNWYANAERLNKQYQNDLRSGFHPAGTTWHGIVMHELGHAIDDYLTNTLHIAGMKNSFQAKVVSADMRPKVMRACKLKVADVGKEVSGYATKDHYEWFAECFCEYMESENPRTVAAEFGRQFEELMKEVK